MAVSRKYIKAKFEGVFYRLSARRDPHTGDLDHVYCFWYTDAEGKGTGKPLAVIARGNGRVPRAARAEFLDQLSIGVNPAERDKVTGGESVESYVVWCDFRAVLAQHRQGAKDISGRQHHLGVVQEAFFDTLAKNHVITCNSNGAPRLSGRRAQGFFFIVPT